MGLLATVGHFMMILAYGRAAVSTLTPFLYTQVGFAMLGGWLLIASVINFLIVGFVAWRLAKVFIKPEPAAAAPATKDCPYCRMTIDAAASRCAHCTSQLSAA